MHLRDALLASAAIGGNITFDPTVFSASNTGGQHHHAGRRWGIIDSNHKHRLTGATSGSGAALTNLLTVSGASASTVFNAEQRQCGDSQQPDH